MDDENICLNSLIDYFKSIMGLTEWDRRFSNCEEYYIQLKTKPIVISGKGNSCGRIFISQQYLCKDIPMWFLYNLYNYANSPLKCDLGLIARIVPKFIRISENLRILSMQEGFVEKTRDLLMERNKNIESIVFEILVGATYLRNGAKKVIFLRDKTRKLADLLVDKDGPLYVECKRREKESEYSKKEREAWYNLYLPVQDYLNYLHKSYVIRVVFHKELSEYPEGFLFDVIRPYIDRDQYGLVVDNENWRFREYGGKEPEMVDFKDEREPRRVLYKPA